jgi:hypothetical protein
MLSDGGGANPLPLSGIKTLFVVRPVARLLHRLRYPRDKRKLKVEEKACRFLVDQTCLLQQRFRLLQHLNGDSVAVTVQWTVKADSHIACRAHAMSMLFPCHAVPLIHTCHAAPLPCSDSAVSLVKVRLVAGNIQLLVQQFNRSSFLQCASTTLFFVHDKCCLVSHWPPESEIDMLLITTFVELRVVAGRSRTRVGNPQAVSRRTCCAVPWPWEERHGRSMAWQVWIRQGCTV